jgi:PAP2 superfamily
LAPPQWHALAHIAALALGTGMAVLRVMAGAHFPSDVIFAGVFTYLIIWVVYAFIYRWPRTRLSDDGVDRSLSRLALPAYNFVAGLFGRKPVHSRPHSFSKRQVEQNKRTFVSMGYRHLNSGQTDWGSTKKKNQTAASHVATMTTITAPKITLPHIEKLYQRLGPSTLLRHDVRFGS